MTHLERSAQDSNMTIEEYTAHLQADKAASERASERAHKIGSIIGGTILASGTVATVGTIVLLFIAKTF